MIRVLMVLFLFSSVACTNKGSSSKTQKMYDEVMAIHDEVMPEMGTIRKLTKELKRVEGAESDATIQGIINDLGDAHESMMSWMAQFKMPKDISEEQEIKFLEKQMVSVNKMKDTVMTAIEKAQIELSKYES